MTQEEIEHMWKVASNNPNHDTNWHDPVVIAFAKLVAAKAIAELESQEQNFCPRCGKRTNDIHTCTPPQEKNT
jgi:hypothetical protein